MENKKAAYIGHQEGLPGDFPIALFNVIWPGNELHGSTVNEKTLNRLRITRLESKAGNRLLGVPAPLQVSATNKKETNI